MEKRLTEKDLARFDVLDAKGRDRTADEYVEHRDLAIRIARSHRTTEAVRVASRALVSLGEEASQNGRGYPAEALFRLAAEIILYGADKAWPWAGNCLAGPGGHYYDAAKEIVAPLLTEGV